MGEVWRVRDTALGREAALKLLRDDLDPDLRARLLREADVGARLQHPAIATFYDSGEDGDVAFLAMELVSGETLRSRLRRGPLPAGDALAIAGALLEALVHAHDVGVWHRDVKPENIMLTGPRTAKLLDFGLARLDRPRATDDATATRLTVEGGILGTPGYASPEQLRGESVDARGDVFSLGATLYEMVSGGPAFPGATAAARFASTLTETPAPLADRGSPLGIEAVLERALARRPADRYPSASAFLADLRALGEGRAIVELAPSLVVLDFEQLTPAPADAWIGSALAESVAADLGSAGVRVIAREKVLAMRRAAEGAGDDDLARRAGVRFSLGGSYQRVGERLRIHAKLSDAAVGDVVATEKLDGTVNGIFELQDRLAEAVAARLNVVRSSADVVAPPAVDAYALYAQGRRAWHKLEKGGFDVAADCFERAIAASPEFAPAHCGLASLHAMRFTFTTSADDLAEASGAARRAIAADPALAEARVWLGYALLRQLAIPEALAVLTEAERLDAHQFFAPYFIAVALSSAGRDREAIAAYQRALAIEPSAGFGVLGLAWAHTRAGHASDARWCFGRAIVLEAGHGPVATAGAACLQAEALRRFGAHDEARAACVAGVAAVEASDHMYRDTMRAIGLITLGRIGLDAGDRAAARAAFGQARAHLVGRPRTLGGGWFRVQALAGLAAAENDREALAEARRRLEARSEGEFSWIWSGDAATTEADLTRASQALGGELI